MYCIKIVNRLVSYRVLATFKVPNMKRFLFTRDSLGVTKYEAHRQMGLQNSLNTEEFKVEFKKQIDQSDPSYNIVPDLKRFLHLMDNSSDDINLLHKALILYDDKCSQHKTQGYNIDKEIYTVGPTVMRALYHFGLVNQAIMFFEDQRLAPIFKQVRTFEILLDWLFDEKRYSQLLQLNEIMMQWIQNENIYPSAAMSSIVMATYLRMGTPETHQLAFKLYQHLKENEVLKIQYRKTIALVGEMKRKEKQPEECLEMLAPHNDVLSEEIRYVKIVANTDLNHFDEVFRLLRIIVDYKVYGKILPQIPNQILRTVEERIANDGVSDNIVKEFQKINKELKRLKRITDKSLDDVLCSRFPSIVKVHGMAVKKGVVGLYREKKQIKTL